MDILNETKENLISELILTCKRKKLVKDKFLKFKESSISNYLTYEDIESFLNEAIVKSIHALENFKLRESAKEMNPDYPMIKESTRFDNFGMLMGYCEKSFHYNVDKYYKSIRKHKVVDCYGY